MKYNIALILVFSTLIGCATFKPQVAEKAAGQQFPEGSPIEKSFYLIGDAGYATQDSTTIGLTIFEKYLKTHKEKGNYAIFLGDNIYPDGMPNKQASDRALAEHRLQVQVNAVNEFDGDIYFIPGNHDWYNEGLKGLKRQEKFLEGKLGEKKLWQPTRGCPITDVEISDDIHLIILDSQWYLEDWDKHPTMNDDCEIKTREKFFIEFEGELKKNQHKTILVALHHPLYSNGVHGGSYAIEKHLYPTQRKLPLPVLASLATLIRTSGGVSKQDNQNMQYQKLSKRLAALAGRYDKVIFASGHEHTLQYIERDNVRQIVSGSGAKSSYATLGKDGLFSYGGQGFVRMDVMEDGSSWLRYYGSDQNLEPQLLFTTQAIPPNKPFTPGPDIAGMPARVTASIYPDSLTNRGKGFKSLWGEHYRDLYGKQVSAPVANLDTLYGGLTVARPGGGHQTRSLRLIAKDGREFNMRALKKSAVQFLQTVLFKDQNIDDSFDDTLTEELLLDFYTSAHPYAAFIVGDLSDQVGVAHTNPKLFYVPKQQALGEYSEDYGDALYMIVDRPEENQIGNSDYGEPDDIESTDDFLAKLREDEKYVLDEPAYVRARIFDMLIGDWDRHADQWRWAEHEENGKHIFRPIPRDRDQVFSNFDGALLGTLRTLIGSVKQFAVYDGDLENVRWFNLAALDQDRSIIRNADRTEWLRQARYIQDNLTDEDIDRALNNLPEEIRTDKTTERIRKKLKKRRDNIMSITERYYNVLDNLGVVTGTDKDDHITVTRLNNQTRVQIWRIKDGKKADLVADRVFPNKETKEIWVYALDDDDFIEVVGTGAKDIRVRIIGGQNNDTYNIENGKHVDLYDYKSKPNTYERIGEASLHKSDRYLLNHYDVDKTINSSGAVLPGIGFNPDTGFRIGLQYTDTFYGFQRNPFTTRNSYSFGYFAATSGFEFAYKGEYAGIFDEWNLTAQARYTTDNFAQNLFGLGNRSENFDDDRGLDYNRVNTSFYTAGIGLIKRGAYGSNFSINTRVDGIRVIGKDDRFITDIVDRDLFPEFYERKWFLTGQIGYNYESYDNRLVPTRGMIFDTKVGVTGNLQDTSDAFGFVRPKLGFYNAVSKDRRWVLHTLAQATLLVGDDYEFYQGADLGGNTGMRAYRNQRWIGDRSFTGSADLRYAFNEFRTGLVPIQIGVFGGMDVGRVWLDGEGSKQWHNGYGGGLWFNSAESINATVNLFTGDDGLRASFQLGFAF